MICCLTAAGCACVAVRLRRRKRIALLLAVTSLALASLHYGPPLAARLWPGDPLRNPIICHAP